MDKEKALAKIKKCLALAKSDNPNESAAALRQAQILMEKYKLTEDDAELLEVNSVSRNAGATQNPTRYHQMLVAVIREAFGVHPVYTAEWKAGYKLSVNFIGIGIQAEIASYAYDVLYRQLKRDRNEYYKSLKRLKRSTKTRRADLFAQQWVNAVYQKVIEFALTEHERTLINKYMAMHHPDVEAAKSREHKVKGNDWRAALAGRMAGEKAQLHHAAGQDQRLALEEL